MATWTVYSSEAISSGPQAFKDTPSTSNRRQHSKSRVGCSTCKRRRIKCDETKPACRQCVDYGRRCDFLSTSRSRVNGEEDGQKDGNERDLFEHVWDKVLSTYQTDSLTNMAIQRANVQMFLHHFINCKDEWLATPLFQELMQEHGIKLGLQSEYLLHAILAVAGCHLHHIQPTQPNLKLISGGHYVASLQLYREKLKSIQDEDLDPIYACGMLHIMMVIRCTMLDAAAGSHMLTGYDTLLAGIKSINSFPALQDQFRKRAQETNGLFHELFLKCDFSANAANIDGMNSRQKSTIAEHEGKIRDLVGSSVYESIFRAPFAHLVRIDGYEPKSIYLDLFMSFSSQLQGSFLNALENKEPMSLLLLCYWFALLSKIKQWWITDPARTLCERIYVYLLGTLPAPLPQRMALLAPAARAIGWGLAN